MKRFTLHMSGGVGCTAALALILIGVATTVHAQPQAVQIIPLAQGFSPAHKIELHAKGPNDVPQSQLVFQPGSDTGWHTQPGPVVAVVKSGALTELKCDGSAVVHPASSVFFESRGEVHRAF